MKILTFFIDESELRETFFHSSGPGGQHVNKTATAVRLTWNFAASQAFPPEKRALLMSKLARKLSAEGFLAVTSQKSRDRELNRADARAKLSALLERALEIDPVRHATRPTLGSVRRRLTAKKQHSQIKRFRSGPADFPED